MHVIGKYPKSFRGCMASRRVAWLEAAALFAALYAGLPLLGIVLDRALGWPTFPTAVRLLGVPLILAGAVGLAWSFLAFVRVGHGTPNPSAPPQTLVTTGPFAWTRNPIAESHVVAALGVVLVSGSPAALLVLLLLAPIPVVLAAHEERVLEARFGGAYRDYRAKVPRWIPRPPRRQS